jgi:hypothetical protein
VPGIVVALLFLASTPAQALLTPAGHQPSPSTTHQVATALGTELGRHRLLAIGEDHRSRRFHLFLQSLIHDRAFICRVDDIVVEFGNAGLQEIADHYVGGRFVARRDKLRMWRDTGQLLVWDSPVYERFFDAIRAINARRLCPRPVRVLLGDPAIAWDKVHSADDYRAFAERDRAYADVVEHEVLAKGHRGLLIAGVAHVLKGRPREFTGGATLGEIIESRHPGVLYSVVPLADGRLRAIGLAVRGLVELRHSPWDRQSYARLVSANISALVTLNGEKVWRPMNALSWPPADQVADALLPLRGPDREVRPDPVIYRDAAYQAELRRRAAIMSQVYGSDFIPIVDAALSPPAHSRGAAR